MPNAGGERIEGPRRTGPCGGVMPHAWTVVCTPALLTVYATQSAEPRAESGDPHGKIIKP